MTTDHHATSIAHEQTRRCASDRVQKLTAVHSDARVDLNPHQTGAALFAFRNSLAIPTATASLLTDATTRRQIELLVAMSAKYGEWFDTEMDKLDRWAEDCRAAFKAELEELDKSIKGAKKSARLAPNLPEKLEFQRKLRGAGNEAG